MNHNGTQIDDINFSDACIQPREVDYVIYHSNCPDGFGSALCAYKYFNSDTDDQTIKQPIFHAGKFGVLPPLDEIKDKCVLICDFSYKKENLQKLLAIVKKLLILDHHKTAQQDLADLPNQNKVFRMDHSGAYLTWRFFFRDQPVPLGLLYIEDNDIWKKALPNTYEVTAFVCTLPFNFTAYEKLLDDDYIRQEAIPQGIGMVKQNNSIISKALKYAVTKFIEINQKYYFVAYLNATELKSELGNKVFSEYPNINFSVIYSHSDYYNSTYYSLRSIDSATDVSEIAKVFGGGGHRNASGASVNSILNTLPTTIIDNQKTYSILNNIYGLTHQIGDYQYHVIYLNTAHHKRPLSKYLLQTRSCLSGQNIQECVSILKNKIPVTPDHSHLAQPTSYDLSAIWNYDGCNDCTWFTVHYTDPSLKEKLSSHFQQYDNFEQFEETFVFSLKHLTNLIGSI